MGRPRKEIDKNQFEKLCALQCTIAEFESFFDIDDCTLDRWCKRTYKKSFSEVYAIKRGQGKISLRRSQWQLAQKNAAMAIFLGKNYLDQKDERQIEVSNIDTTVQELASIIDGIDVDSPAD